MFKKFSIKEDVSSNTLIKSSTQRAIRTKLIQQFPALSLPIHSQSHPSDDHQQQIKPTTTDENLNHSDAQPEAVTLLELIWPKKEPLNLLKCKDHVSILVCKGVPLFFQHFDGPYFPTLKLLHQFPDLLPDVQVDKGAIKFVLAGANIMCPGLTSPGARLPAELAANTPVGVHAEGKQLPCAIGFTQKSAQDMLKINKGIGVDNMHWLGDDLWLIDEI